MANMIFQPASTKTKAPSENEAFAYTVALIS